MNPSLLPEAISVAVELARALAVVIVVGGLAVSVCLLAAGWVLAWMARTVWAAIRPRKASTAPLAASEPSGGSSPAEPAERRSAPHCRPQPTRSSHA